jgi:hypothetical protein
LNLGLDTNYPDSRFLWFFLFLQADAVMAPWSKPWSVHSTSFPIYHALIILHFSTSFWTAGTVIK